MVNSWVAAADGQITTDSTSAMQTPTGDNTTRPNNPQDGSIRFNTQVGSGELEVYLHGRWETIKTNRQQQITVQNFNNGDYQDRFFGPLTYNVDVNSPQNLFVFVDNVYQLPETNYTLVAGSESFPLTTSTVCTQTTNFGGNIVHVESVADFNVGRSINGTNLNGNIVVATSVTDKTITIFPGALGPIYPGDPVIAIFNTGTYILFSEDSVPVPTKPVTVLLGFDGYNPPFTTQ